MTMNYGLKIFFICFKCSFRTELTKNHLHFFSCLIPRSTCFCQYFHMFPSKRLLFVHEAIASNFLFPSVRLYACQPIIAQCTYPSICVSDMKPCFSSITFTTHIHKSVPHPSRCKIVYLSSLCILCPRAQSIGSRIMHLARMNNNQYLEEEDRL